MRSVAAKLTAALRQSVAAAEEHETALAQAYEAEILRVGRAAARRFTALAGLQASASWTPPTTADVLAIAARAGRITRAQRAMLTAVGGTIGDIQGVDFALTHPVPQGILDKLGVRVPSTINGAARGPVAHAISTAWAEGASVPETAAAIQTAVGGVAGFQATMLARTDLIGMSNGGGQWAAAQLNDASQQAGEGMVVQSKTWMSAGDERVRDTHAEADGQTVPMGDQYQVGEAMLMYPGDPDGPDDEVINCRCVETYNEDMGDGAASVDGELGLAAAAPPILRLDWSILPLAARYPLGRAVRLLHPAEEGTMGTMIVEDAHTATDMGGEPPVDGRQRWGSDIAFEGVSTGDGRYMADGSLSWRTPPLTLMAMIETPADSGHAGAQVAGRMDAFSKSPASMDGTKLPAGITAVYAAGVFDTGDYGAEVERMVSDETLRGISVDLAINEWGFRDPDTGEILNPDDMTPEEWDRAFMGDLEFAVLKGEIMAATVCPTPAFADARIALLASARIRPNVWKAGGEYAVAHGLKPDQMMTTLTASLVPEGLAAAGAPRGIAPLDPPSGWFTRPEANEPTPLTVTDEGEIYGHIALWETCHTGFINGEWAQCITPPKSRTGYARFHVGEIVSREGEHIPVGKLTVGTGHAPMSASSKAVRDHYDNTGSVAAFVRAHDGRYGVWVCGATRNDMSGEQLRDLRANPPSGDWRAVDHNLELHAALAVVVPGFPVTRSQVALAASADGQGVEITALILTASGAEEEQAEVTMSADVLAAMIDGGTDALDALIQAA